MKEKKFYDEFIGQNDSAILFNKIKIHEELKNRTIDNYQQKIFRLNEKLINFKNQLEKDKEISTNENILIYAKPPSLFKNNGQGDINRNKKEIKMKILNRLSPNNSLNKKKENYKEKNRLSISQEMIIEEIPYKIKNLSKSQINVLQTDKGNHNDNQASISMDSKRVKENYKDNLINTKKMYLNVNLEEKKLK